MLLARQKSFLFVQKAVKTESSQDRNIIIYGKGPPCPIIGWERTEPTMISLEHLIMALYYMHLFLHHTNLYLENILYQLLEPL